jgi:hypothetical protein
MTTNAAATATKVRSAMRTTDARLRIVMSLRPLGF